ncbi:dynein regulatory complex subunit 5-like [Tenebrio molitor]|uniref:dynein regulatory complex subunit 5-like n=1 Tax=Tenebrio molitor TaxID=7067 RepID=UPI0036247C7D
MRIPVTINPNTLKTFNYHDVNRNVENALQSDNLSDWDQDIPKSLQEICLEAIASNWEANPILEEIALTIDRCFLLNILSTDLPQNLTIPRINDDIYWKRCYLKKWPKLIPENVSTDVQINEIVRVNNGSRKSSTANSVASPRSKKSSLQQQNPNQRNWKECFLEMHLRDYLEKLKPEDYDAEKIKELSDLCGIYVKILDIRELQCSENSPSRIPLNAIITGLENLSELSICFKQTYVGEKFTWDILKVSLHDIKLLAKGLEKCKLTTFRLRNSDVDDEKAAIILKSLLKHDELEVIDFSHCRIGDGGAVALSKFCLLNPVTDLILANNKIGTKGIEALCYAICHKICNLRSIDLKLNAIGENGINLLMQPLTMGARKMKKLYLGGCSLGHIPSIGKMIEHNSSLEHLDLSNNSLGEEMGKIILQGLRYNTSLRKLDTRMCKLNSADEFEIIQKINRNRKASRWSRFAKRPIIVEPQYNFEISDELRCEIENVFDRINAPTEASE